MRSAKILRVVALLLSLLTLLTLSVACTETDSGDTEAPVTTTPEITGGDTSGDTNAPSLPAIWNSATHKEDKTFGEGARSIEVEVVADGHSVTFTVKTDEEFLGAALVAHGIVVGSEGPYGLYIESVNGMVADYDVDQTYWAISKGGDYLMTGVDSTPIENGAHYELTRTKG